MIPKSIMNIALNGDIMAIHGVLFSIQDAIWKTDDENQVAPRELSEEERETVGQMSDILNSKLDTLDDKDLLTVIQMPLINTVPFVKQLIGHDHPTALFRYSWMLQGGYEKYGVEPDMEESDMFLNRAVDHACEVALKPDDVRKFRKSKEINVFDYFIRGEAKIIDKIEKTIASLCRRTGVTGNLTDGISMEMPIGPMMYMLACGDGGGRYTGIIRRCSRQDDVFVLSAECAGISSWAFKDAFLIFFGGDAEIEMKRV